MENASKALIMAGGVLIGVLLLSLAVYLFVDFGSTSAKINEQNAQKQLVEFNSKFTAYEGFKDIDGNWNITIYDIISLASYTKEYNNFNELSNEKKLRVLIGNGTGRVISDMFESEYESLINMYVNQNNGTITKFQCSNIGYDDEGRVSLIRFNPI